MKIAAIIAEYNPFHAGHRYHIEETRRQTGATHVAIVMSGNFTQRGDAAIIPKQQRAEAALGGGADLVVELPVAFALSSAEQFAGGAIHLLNALDCVDLLSFGSESGNIDALSEAAGAVHYAQTTEEFYQLMRKGRSYPAALQQAVSEFYTDDVVDILTTPNNTLAVEYLKAINETGSTIKPFTVQRIGSSHDSCEETDFPCASQIRKTMLEGGQAAGCADILRLETAILAKIRMTALSQIKRAPGVHSGLENRIYKAARMACTLDELYRFSKTKRYTLARIRRAILCCFLGITQSDVRLMPQYVRILGMNARGKEILSAASCHLPIDTSLAALAKKSDDCKRQAMLEDRCTNVYGLAFDKKQLCGSEFTAKPILM
jgi:predicted nucleotidyltransferase